MNKIDEYLKIKELNTRDIENLNQVMRLKPDGSDVDAHNDKGNISFNNRKIWESDIGLYLHTSYGFYGSSDCYSAASENMAKYLLRALNSMSNDIAIEMQELLAADIEKARKAAEAEAREVLGMTKEEKS